MTVYVIGFTDEQFEQSSVSSCVEYFDRHEWVQLDTETTGLFFMDCDLKCFQLGDSVNQYVIHPIYLQAFKYLLETKGLILHNAKFDLKFLYKVNIYPTRVYDTYLAECVLYCGNKFHRKALNIVAKKRLDIDLDKSVRKGIEKKEMVGEVIQYAADDVKYLHDIREHQLEEAKEKDLVKCINLENDYVLVLAYIEFCGIKLDVDKWKVKMASDKQLLQNARKVMDQLIFSQDMKKYINYQMDMFNPELTTRINWDSPAQVIKLFTELGIDCWETVKGVRKQSASAKSIEKYQEQFPFIKDYLHYKELQKVDGTYGQSFLNQVHLVTGRIYTKFTQIMDTGRTSCGGKNKDTGEEYINLQNLPNNQQTRNCFVADTDNSIVDADYSSMEIVVLTNKSLEPGLLEFFDNGFTDFHSYNALKIYPELKGKTPDEVKKNHNDLRQNAKVGGFTVSFGGVGKTVADNLKISQEEGDRFYKLYFEAFTGLKAHYSKCEKQALRDGYILIDDRNRRKSFIYNHIRYKELEKEIDKNFWERYRAMKEANPEDYHFLLMKEKVKEYFSIKGEICRKAYNFPIQGQAASISKIAGIYFMKWIREQGLLGKVLIVSFVHDQYLVECPESMEQRVKVALVKAMEDAGVLYHTRVPLRASAEIGKCWSH